MDEPLGNSFKNEMPSIDIFLLKTPLYKTFYIDPILIINLNSIKYYRGPLDSFCIGCNQQSVFKSNAAVGVDGGKAGGKKSFMLPYEIATPPSPPLPEYFTLEFHCSREFMHTLKFFINYSENKIQKIGQYPSVADLDQNVTKQYRKVLDKKYLELSKAIGLAAHGIGIGSFIYLRRIFESLIEEAHCQAINDENWNEEVYIQSRMTEKIKLLKYHLPTFLVDNSSIYSILSIGVHSLNEDDCLNYFDTLKYSIELILDQKIEEDEKKKKIEKASKAIEGIKNKLKNGI